jgi:hypothetical protein
MIDNLMNKELKEYNEVKLGYVKLTVWDDFQDHEAWISKVDS